MSTQVEMSDLLQLTFDEGASDLHLRVNAPPILRINGALQPLDTPHLTPDDTERLMKSITSAEHQQNVREHGGTDFGFGFGNLARFRVSVFKERGNVGVVLRLIPTKLLTLEQIGLPKQVRELLFRPRGLVLVTGPTGSGKSTTLASMINIINVERDCHIVTVEDPIEYYHSHKKSIVTQRELGVDVPSFAEAIRRALRQDPDVILVGETRDLETAEVAVRASLTGHLVFTTLHTNDAAGAVVRLLDMGVEPYLLASCLRGILAQRLVRRLCPACRRPVEPEPEELRELGERAQQRLRGVTVYAASGCAQCLEGYRGRIGIFELLALDAAMQRMIRSGASASDDLRAFCTRRDLRTLLDDGLDKVAEGATTLSEVLGVAAG